MCDSNIIENTMFVSKHYIKNLSKIIYENGGKDERKKFFSSFYFAADDIDFSDHEFFQRLHRLFPFPLIK